MRTLRHAIAATVVATAVVMAVADASYAYTWWNDFRASALLPDQTVTIRVENPPLAGATQTILYVAGGVQETALTAGSDGPGTLEARVPGPVSSPRRYGFRLVQPGAIDVLSVRLPGGAAPAPADLTRLSADPTGDEAFGRAHLDLVDCRVGNDATRLYAALTNVSGGFPVSSGLTFFSYLLGIKNPAVANPDTLFAMIQTVTAAGIIEPGLYQINGTGLSDLVKIGQITASVPTGANTLVLSCALADLQANAVFRRWYDPADPRLDVAGFSQKITLLGGTQEADRTPGGIWHLREVKLETTVNGLPQLSDLTVPAAGAGGFVSVVYDDPDGNCPVIAEVAFPGGATYTLRPQSLDYGQPVEYRSDTGLAPLEQGGAGPATVRFSDNLTDMITLTQDISSVPDAAPVLRLRASPNPFNPVTVITFELPAAALASLRIYEASGRLVRTLLAEEARSAGPNEAIWNGRGDDGRPLASGTYLYRLEAAGQRAVGRMTIIK